jgi:23S rRNA pseudouridine1911/1915/1917 synthase
MIGLTIGSDQAGQRLDHALSQILPELSRSRIQQLLEQGHITLNGKVPHKSGIRLAGGEQINIHMPTLQPSSQQAENLPLTIQYEDDDLLVIEKAAGMVVHPAPGHASGTLVNALLAHCPNLPGVGDEQRPGIVHRLDKDTSGLLVVAKHTAALHWLQAQFQARTVQKLYLGLVVGKPPSPTGWIEAPLERHPTDRKRMAVYAPNSGKGRPARTYYRVQQKFSHHNLIEFQLETGRTHQIRVHAAFLGCPIAGDQTYGTRSSLRFTPAGLTRQFLHAYRLTLHLLDGTERAFDSPLPPDLAATLAQLAAPV